MQSITQNVTTTKAKNNSGRKLDLKAPKGAKATKPKKLTAKQAKANREAAKEVKGKPEAKSATKARMEEKAERVYTKLWNPADNKKICLKTDLAPHKADYDNQLSMKHFGLALIGITQATDSYLKHRVGSWGFRRLQEKSIVKPVKGKDGVFAIDREKADERYGKFRSDLPLAAVKAGKK